MQNAPVFNLVSNLEIALKNKDKLTHSTPDDFLNDFQKEIVNENNHVINNENIQEEEDFVFCVTIK